MTLPVAVISFNRPDYLAQTLDSLRGQTDRIALFQDGPRKLSDEPLIAACIGAFRDRFVGQEEYVSASNLGPGLNIDRAERWLFTPEYLGVEAGVICEDDMVFSPRYLEVLQAMLDANKDDDRLAYVAAYGPILREPDSNVSPYAPMHLNWGFAVTRNQWLKRKPYVDAYLDLLRGRDYRNRDIAAIMKLREVWGHPGPYTTQDVMRSIATDLVGGIRLNTRLHCARYIGARGLGIDQRAYDAAGFANWKIHQDPIDFMPVSKAMMSRCRELTRTFVGTGSVAA